MSAIRSQSQLLIPIKTVDQHHVLSAYGIITTPSALNTSLTHTYSISTQSLSLQVVSPTDKMVTLKHVQREKTCGVAGSASESTASPTRQLVAEHAAK